MEKNKEQSKDQARDQPPGQQRKRGRWKLLLVVAVCAAPMIASYLTYYVIKPEGRTNYIIEDAVDAEAIGIANELEIINRNSQRLLSLIADLLAVAHEPLKADRRMIDLSGLARLALDNVRERALGAGLTVTASGIGSASAEVEPDRISDLLAKLLSNAILFNRPGGDIAISVTGTAAEVVLVVSDTGIGISADDQPHIFDRFFRGSGAHAGVLAGVGLGLSTAQALVESHDGTISAASELGRGTSITVRLPVHAGR